ncbi:MAG: TonB-dependent receptor, partial [Cyanothece sp. SIO2G6]|nr:TonB-dependent receptor [Cyanothece sp. SIO2G6]
SEDIARNTPNFSAFSGTDSRNFVYYSIRGLSNFNFGSRDPIAFYVDDVPYDFGGFVDLDLTDLERVEILRGPQNTLYGRSSQSGAINIITRQPTNEFEFNGAISYGNFNDFDVRSAISGPIIEDELFYRLSGSYGRRDGFYDNRFLEDEEFDEQSGGTGRAQLLWTPSEEWEVSLNAGFDDYRDGAYPFVALDDDPFDIEQDFNGFINLNTNNQALRVTYRQPRFRVTSITTRRFSEQEGAGDLDFSIADVGQSVGGLDSTVFTQELRLQSPEEAEQLQWIIGGYFESREFDNNGAGSVLGEDVALFFPPPFAPGATDLQFADSRGTTLAGFGQASYSPIEPLTLTMGLRYEVSNSELERFEEVLTIPGSPDITVAVFEDVDQRSEAWLPRFAVDYRLNPNATVYGSITRGYRPGGVSVLANNEASLLFGAERSWNYELGAKTEWLGDRLGVNFALFYNPVDNYQVVTIDPLTRLPVNASNADVSIWGLELEARATPINGFDLIAGLGWVNTQFVDLIDESTGTNFDGNRIPYAPNLTYNLAAQYRSNSGIFGRLELQGVGTTFFDEANTLKQEPYALVNMRLGYELDNYGLYLFANNLLDEEYISQAFSLGADGSAAGSLGAPRTYGIQFRAKL